MRCARIWRHRTNSCMSVAHKRACVFDWEQALPVCFLAGCVGMAYLEQCRNQGCGFKTHLARGQPLRCWPYGGCETHEKKGTKFVLVGSRATNQSSISQRKEKTNKCQKPHRLPRTSKNSLAEAEILRPGTQVSARCKDRPKQGTCSSSSTLPPDTNSHHNLESVQSG